MNKTSLIALAVCLSLTLAGCGGDGDSQVQPPDQAVEASAPMESAQEEQEGNGASSSEAPVVSAPDGPNRVSTDNVVIDVVGDGSNVAQSGTFTAEEEDILTIHADSTVSGGSVELFLFDPNNNEHSWFTFGSGSTIKTVKLTAGTWAYNCSGSFDSGSFTLEAVIG